MKKIILTFIGLLSISVSCMAQTEKGKILLGGDFYFKTRKVINTAGRSTDFGINPVAGFFVADNLVIGAGLGYKHSSYPQNVIEDGEVVSFTQRKAYIFRVNPYGRYYVGITPQLKFFGQLEAAVNWRNIKASDADAAKGEKDFKSNFYTAALSPGFALFPSKKIGIELSFSGFQFSRDKSIGDFQSFSFGSDFFSPRLGIQFYL
ncbi:outer membrane protein [Pedobacter cryoconitis]|uniref:Outer membrane protein n=1 Tax=Pedobacter cryoconitis TaxID=188932 RepID=A0A7W9DJR9_9SPHI|nr:hypothetical protein [Pedobacter cryoconitis]MBB5621501.1 outer membrane protein [Pedobacter cryoconitis]